ncbi:alpha/beta fold hydrolase [Acinetobacter rathckeae]|uniref:alpha/beta fold hydrolase n=1 Tax=Acinetobacter rathckeae TaxID=2605272 RepID=UPI0018A2D398|nr:alpha/beta hydrolase [Acinetobacter rathckeae]MBF7687428.1 alpha/beta hydrolase [Acinetobacter rathckeae]MBF7694829.1 alpha/beta hydrolase [Acinetobacter rathckeae]
MTNTTYHLRPSPYAPIFQETSVRLNNGLNIHVEVAGNPTHPCVVLIMGLGCQMIHWPLKFCEYLVEQGFYVIRFDNRDIGLSSKTTSAVASKKLFPAMLRFKLGLKNTALSYTLVDMAEDTAALLAHLGIKKYAVLGASMGGMIAQILAAKHPQHVEKIGLLFTSNNQAFLPAPHPKQLKVFFSRAKSAKKVDVVAHNVKVNAIIGSPHCVNKKQVQAVSELAYDRCYMPSGTLQQLFAILCTGSLRKWDKKITQPTLVVHGDCDKLLPAKHGKAVATAIKGAKFKLISGMGHDIPDEYIAHLGTLFTQHFKS